MRHVKPLIAIFCFLFFILGCKKEAENVSQATDGLKLQSPAVLSQAASLTPAQVERLNQIRASLPEGHESRLNIRPELHTLVHPEYREMVRQALAITPTPCDPNTDVSLWLDEQLADWNSTLIYLAIVTGMLDFPTFDALLFVNTTEGQTFGVDGAYTQLMSKTFKDLRRFWNIQSDNMVLGAMHGSMLLDRERVIRIDMILYNESREEAEYWADLILELLEIFPQYRNGDHPIFTFNAFAQPGFNFAPVGTVPPKIIMGDGILMAYEELGYADVAPQAILAHEYAHHIQFQLNLFGPVPSPEATRRTELMADAYSSYFLSHARGVSMQWKRVQQFLDVFFNIGDCAITNNGHHGTPTQRMAASEWGYTVADNAQKQGHILTAQTFAEWFELKLPDLVTN